jgi:hypothetical protein
MTKADSDSGVFQCFNLTSVTTIGVLRMMRMFGQDYSFPEHRCSLSSGYFHLIMCQKMNINRSLVTCPIQPRWWFSPISAF